LREIIMENLTITDYGVFLGKHSERLVVKKGKETISEHPLMDLQQVTVATKGVSLSTDLIWECAQRGIVIHLLDFTGQPYAQISSPALTATSAPGGNNSWPTRTNAGWRSPSASPPGRCATRSMLNLEGRAAALYWECEGPENRMMMGQEKFLGKFFEGKKEILGEYRIHSQSTLKTQFSGFGGRGCNLCPVAKGIETWMAVGVPMLVVM
jgi:hypothetical protein